MPRPRTRPDPSSSSTAARHAFLLLSLASSASAASSSSSSSDLPKIDFSSMGTVAVVGNFAGLSLYDPSSPPTTFDKTASTLLARSSDGSIQNLGATDTGGSVKALCQADDGTVFVGGNFTSLGGVAAANVASYDPEGKVFAAMGTGVEGEVRAISCNGTSVYVGGDFASPAENVAAWSTTSRSWSALPVFGLDGAVETIVESSDGRSLFFGGEFSTTFSNSSSNSTSSTSVNSSASSSSSSIPSLGSSLTPISLNSSDYWASPTTYTSGFGRPQYIFCPKQADGPGASWLTVDGQDGYFIARMYRELKVRGIRLGNTFYQGRGTANFSVVALPNNNVLELTYNSDPSDISSPTLTCTSNCPLAHNSSLEYQDFLFPENTTLTGIQLNVLGWYGASAGLHLLQLLSEGSYAYAVASDNTSPCTAGLGASSQASVNTTGNWTTTAVTTSTAGTTQDVLIATIAGGADAADDAPSVTWEPVVTEGGTYAVYLVTPGCTAEGTCSERTSALVTATPNGGSATSTTVDQTNSATSSTLIYNGTLAAGTDSISVTLTLAPGGAAASGQTYQLVADYINLVAASTVGTATRLVKGYGVFEYPLVDTGTFNDAVPTASAAGVNASGTLTNATGFDSLVSFQLDANATVSSLVSVGSGTATQLFVGGEFTYTSGSSTSANILSYTLGDVLLPPNGGLNGPVTSLVALNGALYAAGTFTATADNAVSNLDGVARWNYSTSATAWEALGSVPSVGGSIAQLAVVDGAATSSSNGSSTASIVAVGGGTSGLAFFAPSTGSWNASAAGLFIGNLSAVYSSPSSVKAANQTTYLAGNVVAAVKDAAPGGAVISSGKNGQPVLASFGYGLNSSSSSSSSTSSAASAVATSSTTTARVKRSGATSPASSSSAGLQQPPIVGSRGMSRLLQPRAAQSSSSVNLTLPSPISAISSSLDGDASNEVLVGAFWKNGSTTLMLLGGSFVSSTGVSNLGSYDSKTSTLSALPGAQDVEGTVTALLVVEDTLWVGGNMTTGGTRQGLATYDLKEGKADDSQPALAGYTGFNATVNAIRQRPGYDEQILVAGAFSAAGGLFCQSVCLWDTKKAQWSGTATGLEGVVGSIDFAGSKSEYLLAAGSFVLDTETRYIARWNFKNSTWSGLGAATDLPGPATAVSSDNNNEDKIFVAGQSTSGTPYLLFWDGSNWSDVNTNGTLANGSGVQSLAFVPLQSSHASNSIIESNRMLLVSGDLTINSTAVASALYDGETWYPYLLATSSTGTAGVISQLFYSVTDFSLSGASHLATGIVILISIAIALGVVFLLVLIGLLIALARRKDEPQQQYPPKNLVGAAGVAGDNASTTSSMQNLHRPTSLLQTVGAATAVLLDPKGEKQRSPDGGVGSFDGGAGGAAGAMGYGSDYGDEDDGQPSAALARYSFHAEHEGELSISTNESLTILENSDPTWWLVSNGAGQRGLVPNSYLA